VFLFYFEPFLPINVLGNSLNFFEVKSDKQNKTEFRNRWLLFEKLLYQCHCEEPRSGDEAIPQIVMRC